MFWAIWVQMINQASNLQHPISQDLILSKTIKGIQWTYKMLYLHQECWDQKISFERALKALMRAFLERERASVGFNNIYIHLSSRSFIEYICLKYPVQHFQIGSWAIASSIPFTINFGIVLNYDLFCPNQSYLGQNYQNVPQVFQWKIFMFLINSFFYMTQPVRLGFLKSLSLR